MENCSVLVVCLCILACGYHVSGSMTQDDIRQSMMLVLHNSDPGVIPITGEPLTVNVSLELTSIREVDTVRGEVEILAMRSIAWSDPTMAWDAGDDNGVHSFSIDIERLWSPDIVAYNAVHAPELLSPPIVRVSANGIILYVPNERIRFSCNLESFDTPEGSNCTIKYGSWTYNGGELDLQLGHNRISLWNYVQSPRYELLGTYARVDAMYYPCCPESYPDAKFTLNIRKRSSGGDFFGWKK